MTGDVKHGASLASLKKELRSIPHIKAVDDEITEILKENKGGTDEEIGDLVAAVRHVTMSGPKRLIALFCAGYICLRNVLLLLANRVYKIAHK